MANSNFQDVVVLNSDTLSILAERVAIEAVGSNSIVFAQDLALASAMHLVASNPTAQRTAILPDANGTLGYLTNFSAGTTAITNGKIVFSNSSEFVFGINGNTLTMGLTTISAVQIGGWADVSNITLSTSMTLASSAGGNSTSFSTEIVYADRIMVAYPINATYIDPKDNALQPAIVLRASSSATGTVSNGATVVLWCGLYTFSGSTAGVVSSTSNSYSASLSGGGGGISSVTGADRRFSANFTWNVTPGEYMFFSGFQLTGSMSASSHSGASATQSFSFGGQGETQRQVSYSVPYWANGTALSSATSYNLSDVQNSGGTSVRVLAPYAHMIGS